MAHPRMHLCRFSSLGPTCPIITVLCLAIAETSSASSVLLAFFVFVKIGFSLTISLCLFYLQTSSLVFLGPTHFSFQSLFQDFFYQHPIATQPPHLHFWGFYFVSLLTSPPPPTHTLALGGGAFDFESRSVVSF